MKKMSAFLALFLLAAALTACAGTAQNAQQEDTAPPAIGTIPIAAAPLWTEEEVRSLFEEKATDADYTILACAVVDDGACERIGVVLYTAGEDGITNLASLDADGNYQTCGIVASPWEGSSLSYLGDGTALYAILYCMAGGESCGFCRGVGGGGNPCVPTLQILVFSGILTPGGYFPKFHTQKGASHVYRL